MSNSFCAWASFYKLRHADDLTFGIGRFVEWAAQQTTSQNFLGRDTQLTRQARVLSCGLKMADFIAGGTMSTYENGTNSSSHSRESSMSSERSQGQNKENAHTYTNTLTRRDSDGSDVSGQQLILRDGGKLAEESRTELVSGLFNPGFNRYGLFIIC